jgi:hypothetical protein
MINDLTALDLLCKFFNDVTSSEVVLKETPSSIYRSVEDIITWNKTSEMIVGSMQGLITQPLRVEGTGIQEVNSFKHAEFICSKASQRLQ